MNPTPAQLFFMSAHTPAQLARAVQPVFNHEAMPPIQGALLRLDSVRRCIRRTVVA